MLDHQMLPSRFQIGNLVTMNARVIGVRFDKAKVRYDLQLSSGEILTHVDSEIVDEPASQAKILTDADADADLAGVPRPRPGDLSLIDALQGVREDLLAWKGRAQRAEARLSEIGEKGW